MFVIELDRPWVGTPFPLQGFLITHQAQIKLLASLCFNVKIDTRHSVGVHYDSSHAEDSSEDAYLSSTGDPTPHLQETPNFLEVVQHVRRGNVPPSPKLPLIHPQTKGSVLEEEILYSSHLIDDIQQKMKDVGDLMREDQTTDLKPLVTLVSRVAGSVNRNSEALLWLARLKIIDPSSYDHSLNVSVHMMVLGRFLGLPKYEVERLGMVGMLQDIGKVHLPPELLQKPGKLTETEYQFIQSHVASSLSILSRQTDLDPIVRDIIARHHERIDGSGYPRQLSGEALGLSAEIAGLIDTYCAITRKRSYARTLSTQQAIGDLVAMRGKKFRETIVDQFIQCMGIYPIGSLVELNSGEVGIVIQQNQVRRLRPRVLIVMNADKTIERYPHTIDLLMDPLIPTGKKIYQIERALPEDAYGINPKDFYLV